VLFDNAENLIIWPMFGPAGARLKEFYCT